MVRTDCDRRPGRCEPLLGAAKCRFEAAGCQGWLVVGISLFWLLSPGCLPPAVTFPAEPIARTDARCDYDTDGDGKADFFFLTNPAGRHDRIAYDRDGDGKPDHQVSLDALDPRLCRHLVVVLDGIPFDVLEEFYRAGHLRVFHPPAVVIPPYPAMTDLALEDAFGYMPSEGFEAKYVSRPRRALVGGTGAYLAGRNEPFVRIITYRGAPIDDAFAYLRPKPLFRKELNDIKRLWDRRQHHEAVMYMVSSAAMGSRLGRQGQLIALRECERLIHQVIFETGGLVKVSFFADHGQTNIPARPAELDKHLRSKGWRPVDRLRGERDVVMIRFGLVTYAALNARDPRAVVEDLLAFEPVELASYVDGDAVVVRSRNGTATIRSPDGKTFEYKHSNGDPLKLPGLTGEAVDGRAVLKATVAARHEYPDALYRLWRAHFALVENPPDVIVSLDDRYYSGKGFFAELVSMASTHGGLNRRNSATFFMSTAAAVEGPLRSEDIPQVIQKIFGRPFPYGR